MSILSDGSIRTRMQAGELILGGSISNARHCAYEFKAARVVFGGPPLEAAPGRARAVDLQAPGASSAVLNPKEVVWVKSRETVKIPRDMVGLWVQTNSLSRRGVLLLNATLVEPGYEGFLAAHLVNFGTRAVALGPDTTFAKLVFVSLDAPALETVNSAAYQGYDQFLDQLACESDASFLKISQLMPELKDEAARELRGAVEVAKKEIREFQHGALQKIGGGFVGGLALAVVFAMWIFPLLRTADAESTERIRQVLKQELALVHVEKEEKERQPAGSLSAARPSSVNSPSVSGTLPVVPIPAVHSPGISDAGVAPDAAP